MLKKIVFVIFSIFLSCESVGEESFVDETLTSVLSQNGQITKEIHDKFWTEFDSHVPPAETNMAIDSIKVNVLLAQEFVREGWESCRSSFISQKVVKTKRLLELESIYPQRFEKSLPYPKGSEAYNEAMSAFSARFKISIENNNRLLDAAAKHQNLKTGQGKEIEVTLNSINTVLDNIDPAIERLRKLLNREWSNK